MTSNGIDAHYDLVEFGGNSGNGGTSGTAVLYQDITDFATFTAAGNPFSKTSASGGGTADGSLALQTAMTATFRSGAVQNFILVTDEDDDIAGNRPNLATALAGTSIDELINIIGAADSDNYYHNLAPANGGLFFNITDFRANPASFFDNFTTTKVSKIQQQGSVPEPSILALLGLGLMGLGFIRRKV